MFVKVAFPIPTEQTFDYGVPAAQTTAVAVGKRVRAPFGNKVQTGYVIAVSATAEVENPKDIIDIVDPEPLFGLRELDFYRWVADYYLYPLGKALQEILPGGGNVRTKTEKILTACPTTAVTTLTERQRLALAAVRRESGVSRAELTRLNRNAPPRVVRTDPPAFKNDVSSDLDKITVTFSQPMTDQSWSWTGGGDTYPEVVGKVAYNATRTVCTLPVKLQPGKVYWVGVNSPSHRNFKSASGVPVPTYVILFATAGTDGKPTEIPADMLASARRINQAAEAGDSAVSPQSIPVIVKTEPAAFDRDVPANLDKITVTFSRPMTDRSWSWTGGGDTYPEVVGKIAYNDTQTVCTLPVKLHPGKVYWVGVNGPSYRNFKSAEGVPAPWYVILFATADADGKPTPIPDDLLQRARKINEKAKKVAARAGAATREE